MKKTIVPNDFRDFLSLVSLVGFLGIFFAFSLNLNWLQNNSTGIFLLIAGTSFLVVGKAFKIKQWAKDGIQQNEISRILALVIGLSSIVIGLLLILNVNIPSRFLGYVGLIALVPAIYTIVDYFAKNLGK
jgi:hypothetical protein